MAGAPHVLFVVASGWVAACGSSSHGGPDAGTDAARDAPWPCADIDFDSFTDVACGGTDCDDFDDAVHTPAECEARCAQDDHAATCLCSTDEDETCYSGPEATRGVGACFPGRRECRSGRWSSCEGETTPLGEACNSLDDDCNGVVDDGVLSVCGDCNPECRRACQGPRCGEPFTEEGARDLVLGEEDGCLTLAAGAAEGRYEHVWSVRSLERWREASYEAELAGESTLELEVRVGNTLDQLNASAWTRLGTGPADPPTFTLSIAGNGDSNGDSNLALRATLRTPGGDAARLCELAVEYTGFALP